MTFEMALLESRMEGREEEKKSIAENLIRLGFKFDDICKATKLSIDKIKEIAKKISSSNS